jgi:hypothetical protein
MKGEFQKLPIGSLSERFYVPHPNENIGPGAKRTKWIS